jgi:tRNA(fMet)-specific endonuclease VapC
LRVFDSSFIIDLIHADPQAAKLSRLIDDEHSVAALSAVSVHEYLLGIHLKYFRDEDLLKEKLEAAEKDLMPFMVLPLTKEIAMESAKIQATLARRGRTIGINDIYIAATAMVNKASLVTRNASHFDQVEGLLVEKY